jgi:hypothetical protein
MLGALSLVAVMAIIVIGSFGVAMAQTSQTIGSVTAGWSVIGLADFINDNKQDILWRHTSGTVVIWYMNGSTIVTTQSLGTVGTDWTGPGNASEVWIVGSKVVVANTVGGTALWFDFSSSESLGAVMVNGSYLDAEHYGVRVDGAGSGTLVSANFTGNVVRVLRSASSNGACFKMTKGIGIVVGPNICDVDSTVGSAPGYSMTDISGLTNASITPPTPTRTTYLGGP